MISNLTHDLLVLDREPRKLRIECDPYVAIIESHFYPVIDVYELKSRRLFSLIISPHTIASELLKVARENNGQFRNLEFWINSESDDLFSDFELFFV